jgi:hypothetical protein
VVTNKKKSKNNNQACLELFFWISFFKAELCEKDEVNPSAMNHNQSFC